MITFLGDVYLPRPFDCEVMFNNYIFNLEHPITYHEDGYPGKVNLKAEREHITKTFTTKPLAANIANNHILDYGHRGIEDTLDNLRKIGIEVFGAGPADCNHNNPAVVTIDNHEIGLLGYLTPTLSRKDYSDDQDWIAIATPDRLTKDIIDLKQRGVDRIVVQVHGGSEDVHFPTMEQIRLGRSAAELGADLVLGHHSHCIQPWERYNDTPIFYGLGNCIMPSVSVPSYFDESGEPTETFEKPQHWWNRKSLGIKYDPDRDAIEKSYFHFDQSLNEVNSNISSAIRADVFRTIPNNYLSNVHTTSYIYGFLRKELMNYIHDPTVITPRSLRDMFRRIKN